MVQLQREKVILFQENKQKSPLGLTQVYTPMEIKQSCNKGYSCRDRMLLCAKPEQEQRNKDPASHPLKALFS